MAVPKNCTSKSKKNHIPISGHLGALVGSLDYSPLDDEAYPPPSHWLTFIPGYLGIIPSM